MGRIARAFRPNVVLTRASYKGIRGLVKIIESRTKHQYRSIRKSIYKMWNEVRHTLDEQEGIRPDYFPLSKKEANIRKTFLQFLWMSTVPYGNKERKRVYDWAKGTVGPLNALLNYAGARLRELAMTRYPFPEPRFFQIWRYPDGSYKVYAKELIDSLKQTGEYEHVKPSVDENVKVYWKAGYSGTSTTPQVFLAHPTLPSLDFVDMIRCHVYELCRQCFIHNVPRTEAHRYIRRLILKLRPYLDWVYTEGKDGKPYFIKDARKILWDIILELRALYGRHIGERRSITASLDDEPEYSLDYLKSIIEASLENSDNEEQKKQHCHILNLIDQGILHDRDVEKLTKQMLQLSSEEGTRWHRVLLSALHHPKSLKQVVFAGDKMMDTPSSVLVVGELPLKNRQGQVDLTFFIRRKVGKRCIWTPVMVLEVKTKTGFEFNIFGKKIGSKTKDDYVPVSHVWKRGLTQGEWDTLLISPPDKEHIDQLRAYENLLLDEYGDIMDSDMTPPMFLWKGIIILDTDQSPEDVFDDFQRILEAISKKLEVGECPTEDAPSSYTIKERVALLTLPSRGPIYLLQDLAEPTIPTVENPFKDRVADERFFTLYVSIPAPTSSGTTAAYRSRNYHLLHHIRECREVEEDPIKVYWIDLLGDFSSEQLVQSRFGLDFLLGEKKLTLQEYHELQAILKDIVFISPETPVDELLADTENTLEQILEHIDKEQQNIIILDGWSELKKVAPSSEGYLLKRLELLLLEQLPTKNTNLIWIDEGVQHTRFSADYQRNGISPLPFDSPRRYHLDEILYNIPLHPRCFGNLVPWREDLRIIVQDIPTKTRPWQTMIHVPYLIDFSRRFRGSSRRDGHITEADVRREVHTQRNMYARETRLISIQSSIERLTRERHVEMLTSTEDLIPSLGRPRSEEEVFDETIEEKIPFVSHEVVASSSQTLMQRVRFCSDRPPPESPRSSKTHSSANKITRRWFYERTPRKVLTENEDGTIWTHCRPPSTPSSLYFSLDTVASRLWEIRRIYSAAQYLLERLLPKGIQSTCEKIVSLCKSILSSIKGTGRHDSKQLLQVLYEIQEIILSEDTLVPLWETLRPQRKALFHLLNSDHRQALEGTLEKHPDLFLLYGNNLFLLVCAVIQQEDDDDLQSALGETLWEAVTGWTLYQMGLRSDTENIEAKYDLYAIHRDLEWRKRILMQLHIEHSLRTSSRAGHIIWLEEGNLSAAILVVPHTSHGYLTGCITGLLGPWLSEGWSRCETDPAVLNEMAQGALGVSQRTDVLITEVEQHRILWLYLEEEDTWTPYVFEHSTLNREHGIVPWIKLSNPFVVPSLSLENLHLPVVGKTSSQQIDTELLRLVQLKKEVIPVTLTVALDEEWEEYVIDFETTEGDVQERITDTDELVSVLRRPISRGVGYETTIGYLSWDHRSDITYDGSLTFLIPLVKRSWFLRDLYQYPTTCHELLSMQEVAPVTMKLDAVDDWYNEVRISITGVSSTSSLAPYDGVVLSLFEAGLLVETTRLFDTKNQLFHEVKWDVRGLLGVEDYHLRSYPRLQESVRSVHPDDFDWTRNSWNLQVSLSKTAINWHVVSLTTGKIWMNNLYSFQLDPTRDLESILAEFQEVVSSVVDILHLENVETVFGSLREDLICRGWSETPPQCIGEISGSAGDYTLTIRRWEEDGTEVKIYCHSFTETDCEALIEAMEEEGSEIGQYLLLNETELTERLAGISELYKTERESREDSAAEEDVLSREDVHYREVQLCTDRTTKMRYIEAVFETTTGDVVGVRVIPPFSPPTGDLISPVTVSSDITSALESYGIADREHGAIEEDVIQLMKKVGFRFGEW